MQIYQVFCFQDPWFLKENLLPRPYSWKLVQHTLTKKIELLNIFKITTGVWAKIMLKTRELSDDKE